MLLQDKINIDLGVMQVAFLYEKELIVIELLLMIEKSNLCR